MAQPRPGGTSRHRATTPRKAGGRAAVLATALSAAATLQATTGPAPAAATPAMATLPATARADVTPADATRADAPPGHAPPRHAPPAPATRATPPWTEGPVFNDPLGTVKAQHTIRTRLVRLTDAAVPGSTIKAAVYHLWEAPVVDALLHARERGVDVQVLLDSTSRTDRPNNPAYSRLATSLGTDRRKKSFVSLCPADKSCLGDPRHGKSIMHNKFWLFSEVASEVAGDVAGARDVVVQTTSNSTPSAHTKFFNDALLLPGNPALYDAFAAYFDDMLRGDWRGWDYRTASSGLYKTYFFPREGTLDETDTLYAVLNNVSCAYKDANGVERRTRVRASVFKITRKRIADKLVSLKKAGCAVDLVYAETDSARSQGGTPGTWEALHRPGGPSLRCYNDDRDPLAPGRKLTTPYIIHSKYVLIDGVYDGRRNKVSFTGSQNYTAPALRENDEVIVKVDDDSVHDTYRAHFDRVRKAAWPGTADRTDLCRGVKPLPPDGEKPTG
ncbi:phospholipase D-like domain-containing protein [Streptomyces sp. NPDC017941]|uniref:phospholipase D-like domain-containing protein n=1 Tax=Streptomyces sp. NPDC017941 TaxID=3365018 RepID=UPI00379A5B87